MAGDGGALTTGAAVSIKKEIQMQTTPCIRCGKMRIPYKTWTDKSSGAEATYTTNVCPDPKCQKIVDEQLRKKLERVNEIKNQSALRRANNSRRKRTDIVLGRH